MAAGGFRAAKVPICQGCGRELPSTGTAQVASRTLCLHCALEWQKRHRADWPPPGYVWDGERVWFDPTILPKRSVKAYRPTDREVQWWCFLSWMVATGRIAVGMAEGADDTDD